MNKTIRKFKYQNPQFVLKCLLRLFSLGSCGSSLAMGKFPFTQFAQRSTGINKLVLQNMHRTIKVSPFQQNIPICR
jgi:hypothetical protein